MTDIFFPFQCNICRKETYTSAYRPQKVTFWRRLCDASLRKINSQRETYGQEEETNNEFILSSETLALALA